MKKFLFASLICLTLTAVSVANTSCKAVRTITTTSSFSQVTNDSAKVTTTIQTKTVEDYQGTKKH